MVCYVPFITDYSSSLFFFKQCTVQIDNFSFGVQISIYWLLTSCFCVVEFFLSSSLALTVAAFMVFFGTMAVLIPVISLHYLMNIKCIGILLPSFSFCESEFFPFSCCMSVTFLSL